MREKTVEDHLIDAVEAQGGVAWKLPAHWYRHIPDRLVLLPGARIAFVELKRPGKTARPGQLRMGRILQNMGFVWAVLDSKPAVDRFLNNLSEY